MKKVLTVIGTRPEAIKLAPLLEEFKLHAQFQSQICLTRQHTNLLDPFLKTFGIQADYDLGVECQNGSLHQSAGRILQQFSPIFEKAKPDIVIVQGDTTSAFIGALASFYSGIPVAHVEAGLRTGNLYAPWPEEAHRFLIAKLATLSFAPTEKAKEALIQEGVSPDKIWVVGNTAIDAIRMYCKKQQTCDGKRRIVATVHRRENHGKPLEEICKALVLIAKNYPYVQIEYCLHSNPKVRETAIAILGNVPNIILHNPLDHIEFIELLESSDFIVTDSGGIQEEATFIGKPVLVLRNITERPEGIAAGTSKLAGTTTQSVFESCKELLENPDKLKSMSRIHYPYGDGFTAEKIVKILSEKLL